MRRFDRFRDWVKANPLIIALNLCLIAITGMGATIFWVAAFWHAEKGEYIASWVSIILALISIAVALLVIVYMFLQGFQSQANAAKISENITQMKSLVSDIPDIIKQTHELIGKVAKGVENMANLKDEPSQPDFETITAPGGQGDEISLQHTEKCKWVPLLTFYSVAKAYKSGLPIQTLKITEILFADKYPPSSEEIFANRYMVFGVILGLSGFLTPGSITFEPKQITINKLPSKFVDYMPKVLQKRIGECEEPYKSRLQNFKNKIDEYLLSEQS